jgi:hypothetical protein
MASQSLTFLANDKWMPCRDKGPALLSVRM